MTLVSDRNGIKSRLVGVSLPPTRTGTHRYRQVVSIPNILGTLLTFWNVALCRGKAGGVKKGGSSGSGAGSGHRNGFYGHGPGLSWGKDPERKYSSMDGGSRGIEPGEHSFAPSK